MPPLSSHRLISLVAQLDRSSEDDRNELLTDFLVQCYPTRRTQNN